MQYSFLLFHCLCLYYPKCILLYRLPYQKSIQHDSFLTFSTHNEVFLQASSHRYTNYIWFKNSSLCSKYKILMYLVSQITVGKYFQDQYVSGFTVTALRSRMLNFHEVLGSKTTVRVYCISSSCYSSYSCTRSVAHPRFSCSMCFFASIINVHECRFCHSSFDAITPSGRTTKNPSTIHSSISQSFI